MSRTGRPVIAHCAALPAPVLRCGIPLRAHRCEQAHEAAASSDHLGVLPAPGEWSTPRNPQASGVTSGVHRVSADVWTDGTASTCLSGMDTTDDIAHARAHIVVANARNSRECTRAESRGELVRVYRNILVTRSYLETEDWWEFVRRTNLVRAIAVCLVHPGVVVSHGTALDVRGVAGLGDIVDVHVVVGSSWRRGGEDVLPALRIGTLHAPGASIVRHRFDPPAATVEDVGIPLASLELAAVQCAFACEPREAVVLVSGALRRLCGFDRFDLEGSRVREEVWRNRMKALLDELPTRRHRVRARVVLEVVDGAFESVPERLLLWILAAAGFGGVKTQMRIEAGGRTFYADFGVPDLWVVIEFDGKEKYGRDRWTILESLSTRDRRQKLIEAAGWTVVRFEFRELGDPAAVAHEVASRVRGRVRLHPIRVLAG